MFAGNFGPSLAAIVVVARTRSIGGLRGWLSRCLQWRVGWEWCAFALLLPLIVMLLAAGLHIALGGDIVSTAQAHIPLALFLLSVVAALLFHTAINFWPSIVPVLPAESSSRAYAFVVVMMVLLAQLALKPPTQQSPHLQQAIAKNRQ